MAVKYKQYVQNMYDQHSQLFADFREIHDGFIQDPDTWGEKFHSEGRRVLDVLRDWERRLCSGSERGKFAKYSANLADKFWAEVKKEWPVVDQIGLKRKK